MHALKIHLLKINVSPEYCWILHMTALPADYISYVFFIAATCKRNVIFTSKMLMFKITSFSTQRILFSGNKGWEKLIANKKMQNVTSQNSEWQFLIYRKVHVLLSFSLCLFTYIVL